MAVSVEGLGKRYRLGAPRRSSFRDGVGKWLRRGSCPVTWALRDVSFQVRPGEITAVIGPNGAGKSTLLKILSRVSEPTTGIVRLRGRVGALLGVGAGFHPELSGRENVYLVGAILGMGRREISRKMEAIAELAELASFLETPIKRFSAGMCARLAFSVAAHLEPGILLIDELLAVADLRFQERCLEEMGRLARGGTACLIVTHDLEAVRNHCHSARLLLGGRLHAEGEPATVLETYRSWLASPALSARTEGL